MELDPETRQYTTADKDSFAYITTRDRWPVIITGAIDDVYRSVSRTEGDKLEEGKEIVKQLTAMKYELQHDRKMVPLQDDGQTDIALYNKELEKLKHPTWFNVPWLFAECYFYRRIQTFFALSIQWATYDVFSRQKLSTFRSSRSAVLELASHYRTLREQLTSHKSSPDPNAEEVLFREMCEICLWGNATDLSLLTSLSYEDIQKLQGSEARKASESNILTNDLGSAFEVLQKAKESAKRDAPFLQDRRIDIVLDNAGFELYVDLVLAAYLLDSGLATTIILHAKKFPWFVSDVIPADFASLLSALAAPKPFYETPLDDENLADAAPPPALELKEIEDLNFIFQTLSSHHAEGKLILRPHPFWTYGGSFWRMHAEAPDLYEDLKGGILSIWKGDLNYRKLCADADWDPATPFQEAIGPMGKNSGINVLALRTCKADVVTGLKKGDDERLKEMEGGSDEFGKQRKWAWGGKWALCSLSQGK
ncbi:uncharacterized protein MKZ38_006062 [Zalerion maritima]|uniref:Sugar phosphate phosphatase n=1 Tax=Zalerion maritima TaxID=339359 RepID=A0AAD5RJW0_9PEZI|nr:uncharacterized protein MKZ38_006062 [Zalerion maritima]